MVNSMAKTVDLKDIKKVCEEYNNSVELINNKIKSLQSRRCRLKKFKNSSEYQDEMTQLLQYEQILKEAKSTLVPKKKFVTEYNQEDINKLDFDETRKALKSIQSKKCLSQQYGQEDEYLKAENIESMLKEHLQNVKPLDDSYIRKTDLQTVIETIENDITIDRELILEHLKNLI